MLAYLMLFSALLNAVCLHNAYIFAIDFCKCNLLSCFVIGLSTHSLSISNITTIMYSAFKLLVFLILCSRRFLCALKEIALKNINFYYYYYLFHNNP